MFFSRRAPDSFLSVGYNNVNEALLASFVGQRMNKLNSLDFIVLQSTVVKFQQTPRLALFDCRYVWDDCSSVNAEDNEYLHATNRK